MLDMPALKFAGVSGWRLVPIGVFHWLHVSECNSFLDSTSYACGKGQLFRKVTESLITNDFRLESVHWVQAGELDAFAILDPLPIEAQDINVRCCCNLWNCWLSRVIPVWY